MEAFARANGLRKGAGSGQHGRKPYLYIIIYIGQAALSAVSYIAIIVIFSEKTSSEQLTNGKIFRIIRQKFAYAN